MTQNVTEEKKKPIETAWDLVGEEYAFVKKQNRKYANSCGRIQGVVTTACVGVPLYWCIAKGWFTPVEALICGGIALAVVYGRDVARIVDAKIIAQMLITEQTLKDKLKKVKIRTINGAPNP